MMILISVKTPVPLIPLINYQWLEVTYKFKNTWHWHIPIFCCSARFETIQKKSIQKWLYHRHLVIIAYEERIPSPLNFPIRLIKLLSCVKILQKCGSKNCQCCTKCCRQNTGTTNYIHSNEPLIEWEKNNIILSKRHKHVIEKLTFYF